ncbi:hypothetical protein [Rufibacter tibetensis]|uniref:hypothetical protein n=1 Tax=Rufibacter tibetensis TaxID=512763 RepID=UPI0012F81EAB|nr:hypothetical protein [Rufibacter tibetensis]
MCSTVKPSVIPKGTHVPDIRQAQLKVQPLAVFDKSYQELFKLVVYYLRDCAMPLG